MSARRAVSCHGGRSAVLAALLALSGVPAVAQSSRGQLVPPVAAGPPGAFAYDTGCGGAAPAAVNAAYEQQVAELVNRERKAQGLPPLKLVAELTNAARYHAKDMADDDYFAHDTYDLSGGNLVLTCTTFTRLSYFYPWTSAAENIAVGYATPQDAMAGWMNSSGHRANILSTSSWEIGTGYWSGGSWGTYWVQDFGRRANVYPLVINDEAAATRNRSVTLYVYGSWTEMRLRNDQEAFGPWVPFSSTTPWTLANVSGERTVTVEVRSGSTTRSSSDTITLSPSTPGDLGGDVRADIVWRHSGGALYVWQMNGTALAASSYLPPIGLAWTVQGRGDFDGDGKSDLLWRETTSGSTYLWLMNGASTIGAGYTSSQADGSWSIQGVGDFDADGKADILWRHTGGALYVWQMDGTTVKASSYLPPISTAWQIEALGDLNGDGKTDVLWREVSSGSTYVWLMDGASTNGSGYTASQADGSWSIQGVGDLDADGRADILWRHAGGALYVWQMNGTLLKASSYLPPISLSWTIQQLGDYNGDGTADILWREGSSGSTYIWFMNGATTIGSGYTSAAADNAWTVQAP